MNNPLVSPDLGLIFWSFVTFVIVFLILRKYAFRPIVEALKEREAHIDNALKSAEQARLEMAKLKNDNEKLLDEARAERDTMMKKAQQTADRIVEESKEKAAAESNKIVEAARLAIQQERQAAIQDIKQQVASLSLEIAEQILRGQLKDKPAQRTLVSQLINDAKLN